MDQFSISQLAKYAGLKPHTIRVWEQRYGALRPHRSEGNTRYYDNTQLRRLLNIVSLSGAGHKVSALCEMPDSKLFQLINEAANEMISKTERVEYFISQLIAAGMSYDEIYFEKLLSNCLLRLGVRETYLQVIYPMLIRIGLMWAGDAIPPANEHFISNLLRQKLFTAIDSLPPQRKATGKWLLFLQENEFHEIGLLFASYLVRLSGQEVFYLGADVPFESLRTAIKNIKPDYLLFFIVHKESPEVIDAYIGSLHKIFTGKRILVSAHEQMLQQLKRQNKVVWIPSVDELDNYLSSKDNKIS
jgi:DNA-binding transcriptional MerR regulator